MSSILTNMSAMSAVANLTATQSNLATVQNQISTGLKVSSSKDNAAYFSIATTLRTQTGELSAAKDAINLGSSILGTATAAYSTSLSLLQKIASDLVTATSSGVGSSSVQTDIKSLQDQLRSSANSASFNGVNLLSYDSTGNTSSTGLTTAGATTATIVTSVTGSGTSSAKVATQTLNSADFALVDSYTTTSGTVTDNTGTTGKGILTTNGTAYTTASILTFDITNMSSTDLANVVKDVNGAIASLNTANAKLGAQQNNITLQSSFLGSLSDAVTTGIGSLVDADMNQASTRLSALQTQQQLGIQALSVANQNSQLILKLFG